MSGTPSTLRTAVATLRDAVTRLQSVDLAAEEAEELVAVMGLLEVERRRLDAATGNVVSAVDRSGAFGVDGHRSPKGSIVQVCRVSGAEAGRRVRAARALQRLPRLADAHAAGEVPTEHVRIAANVVRNPRIDHFITDSTDELFTDLARRCSHDAFSQTLRQWERMADQDGAHDGSDRAHARRRITLTEDFDGSHGLEGRFGALQGAVVAQVLAPYEDREFEIDWAEAREIHGDDVRVEHLARTPNERRADAFVAMCRRAASVDVGSAVEADPLVNVVVDHETFERAMAVAAGEDVGDDDPNRAETVRCATDTGTPLTLLEVAECAILGHVRRVVLDSRNVVIDLGRKERLFKRGARDAVLLGRWPGQDPGCEWPGCGVSSRRVQIDHVEDYANGGPTTPANGKPLCGHHNRLKNAGFRVHRDAAGRDAVFRPDGQPLTAGV